jgi:methionyl-tRNA formyltransferase
MTTVKLGPIRRLLLLGGGDLLLGLAEMGRRRGLAVDVVTSPDQSKEKLPGTGRSLVAALREIGIKPAVIAKFDQPETARRIGDTQATFVLSVGARWIFRADKIERWFGGKLFNLHGTRLPQNRGGGTWSWQILMGNRFGFCQLHLVDAGIDTGPTVVSEEFIYPPACRTPQDYIAHAAEQYVRLIGEILDSMKARPRAFACTAQPEYLSTYWPRLDTATHGWIDWRWDAALLERFICAFDEPYAGAQTLWNGRTVHLKRAFANREDQSFHPFQSGIVYRTNKRWLCIAADGGSIVVEDLRDGKGVSVLSEVRAGDAFTTPPRNLQALGKRIEFGALGRKR